MAQLVKNLPAMQETWVRSLGWEAPLEKGKCREPVRHSTRDKGHEEGGSAYAKAGSSLRSPLDILEHLPPKTRVCLLYCFVLSPLTLLGAVPHHHLSLSDKAPVNKVPGH